MNKERINLTDSPKDILVKMCDGNPGALNALISILKSGEKIDPDSAMGGLGAILYLDSWGIYGSDIYVLNNDICKGDTAKTLAVIRATQFGYFDRAILKDACARQDRSGSTLIPVDELYVKVKEHLPNFDNSPQS